MNKTVNQKAWFLVLPVLVLVAFSAVIPLMTVVNYSVQDILDFNSRFFVGLEWYRETLADERFREAFLRQVAFSVTVLLIEIPLGIAVAKGVPRDSRWTPLVLINVFINGMINLQKLLHRGQRTHPREIGSGIWICS